VALSGGAGLSDQDCRLRVGVYYQPPNATWNARFDNVVVTKL
jgi:hypothetical protein